MSACGKVNQKFTITKGIDNTFVFTIKADNSTLALVIDPTDTFTASIRTLSDSVTVITKPLVVTDARNGMVSFTLSASETANLLSTRGSIEDRYYIKPTYSLLIDCKTVGNGDFIAKVPLIYVD